MSYKVGSVPMISNLEMVPDGPATLPKIMVWYMRFVEIHLKRRIHRHNEFIRIIEKIIMVPIFKTEALRKRDF